MRGLQALPMLVAQGQLERLELRLPMTRYDYLLGHLSTTARSRTSYITLAWMIDRSPFCSSYATTSVCRALFCSSLSTSCTHIHALEVHLTPPNYFTCIDKLSAVLADACKPPTRMEVKSEPAAVPGQFAAPRPWSDHRAESLC